ncbi:hypothetical protein J2129_001485 [Methanofollis sp. W23]|uniref:hypothetical protein n=1 Tax=Methanofollis sp. W23 TaxID=2817849 RepID=UPI001AEB8CF5|nr:hypothetical protein [Methanofollis sp. W23]MBP2146031.1 hypothetical protein [Methanofollis sp. W23]
MARQITILFLFLLVLIVLLLSSGCTTTPPPEVVPVNETPTLPVLHHGEIAIDLSEIEIKDPELFTANLTSTISTVLTDRRATLLLDHGWNITSVRQEFDEEVLDHPYVEVEFMKNDLSFYFWVDMEEEKVFRGYCGAEGWISSKDPLPKDYHQALDKHTRRWYVFDDRNGILRGEVMIYDGDTIYYLDPEF